MKIPYYFIEIYVDARRGALVIEHYWMLPDYACSIQNTELDADNISLLSIDAGILFSLQKKLCHAITRKAPGRNMGFAVLHNDDLIGIINLRSPIINLGVRDTYLNLSKCPSERGASLRNYMDLSVCVGVQPLAWYWNVGKLCAMLATTLTDEYKERYGDDLLGIVTTSIYGRSCQYNRIYKFLGYTKGFGHEHVSDEEYMKMLKWMRDNGHPLQSNIMGQGSNTRMIRINQYYKYSGKNGRTKHNNKRGVYYCSTVPSELRQDVVNDWYARWGLPRYISTTNQTSPYQDGLTIIASNGRS